MASCAGVQAGRPGRRAAIGGPIPTAPPHAAGEEGLVSRDKPKKAARGGAAAFLTRAMSVNSLFDTQFVVKEIDPDGKKFDRGMCVCVRVLTPVSRVIATSPTLDMTLSIDIATDIYPVHVGQQLAFLLVSSLRRDKAESDSAADRDAWRLDQDDTSLASGYDYVMYGKIFKYDERSTEQVSVYGSFGGLLMALTGSFRHLSKITVGANVYLLVR